MKTITLIIALLMVNLLSAQTVGLFTQNPGSLDGYVLFAPTRADSTYLIDKCGYRINQWSSAYTPGLSVYLLPDGDLLRTGNYPNVWFGGPGGVIERYDWNNNLEWQYILCNAQEDQNHDIFPMPNGNILVAVWEKLTVAEAIAAGRDPGTLGTSVISAKIIEIEPVGASGANIVWEWRLWDHLVQDFDAGQDNYGVVVDHPELLNVNFTNGNDGQNDWTHLNAVIYNPQLDQVMISLHTLSEIYIIDHSTTIAEAASHSGGMHGKGGDFLYRWGNPAAYNRGTAADQRLFSQHSPEWILPGLPGENKIMIFNNGVSRPTGNWSSVDIIEPPIDSLGNYTIDPGLPFTPADPEWSYADPTPTNFYSAIMGGSTRLSNGNTMFCESTTGSFFEVDAAKNIVWHYVNPVNNAGIITQGTIPMGNLSYRCVYYPLDYPGFVGHTLTPGAPIELNPLSYNCTMNVSISTAELSVLTDDFISARNPFSGNIELASSDQVGDLTVQLYDVTGQLLETWHAVSIHKNSSLKLNGVADLPSGVYFLTYSNSEVSGNKKLMKMN